MDEMVKSRNSFSTNPNMAPKESAIIPAIIPIKTATRISRIMCLDTLNFICTSFSLYLLFLLKLLLDLQIKLNNYLYR